MTLHGRVRLDRPQRLRLILLFLGLASAMADKEVLSSVFVDRDGAVNLENALYLEGLATVGPDANSKIEDLSLSVAFVGPNSKELYANAVRNLKQALPNVKTIKLNGGYVFDPANDNPAVFDQEAQNLKTHFDTLAELFRAEELPVSEVKFTAMMTFKGETVDNANFAQIYEQLFGAQPTDWHRENRQVNFEYTKNDVKFVVKCSLSLTILKQNKGVDTRYEFYDELIHVTD